MKVDQRVVTILLRESCYSMVDGYKDPFLDNEATQSNANDIYSADTAFNWLYSLFKFDKRILSNHINHLIQVEAVLKTTTMYAFCGKR